MGRINQELLKKFEEDLQNGILTELLRELKKDDTISLEFRTDYISIYYRGGCVSKLTYNKNEKCYVDEFNSDYEKTKKSTEKINKLKTNEDCVELIERIHARKRIMNKYFKNSNEEKNKREKIERQYQQIIEWENNRYMESNYTITDIEYQKGNDFRFDLIALHRKRQKDYRNLKLSIIELKYAAKSLENDSIQM